MKRSLKIAFRMAYILILAGVAISFCGFAAGGFDINLLNMDPSVPNAITVEEPFDSISISASTADITVFPSTDESCKIELMEKEKVRYSAKVEDNVLKIYKVDDRKWYDHIGISWGKTSITLYLPRERYNALSVAVSTGDVTVDERLEFGSGIFTASTGDITVNCNVTDKLMLSTHTGDISIHGVSDPAVSVSVNTGNVTLCDSKCTSVDIETDTGDVRLSDLICEDTLKLKTDTGDVIFDRCDAPSISIETDTGDVDGSLLSSKIFSYETDTGDVILPQGKEGSGECNIKTDTGDITIVVS